MFGRFYCTGWLYFKQWINGSSHKNTWILKSCNLNIIIDLLVKLKKSDLWQMTNDEWTETKVT